MSKTGVCACLARAAGGPAIRTLCGRTDGTEWFEIAGGSLNPGWFLDAIVLATPPNGADSNSAHSEQSGEQPCRSADCPSSRQSPHRGASVTGSCAWANRSARQQQAMACCTPNRAAVRTSDMRADAFIKFPSIRFRLHCLWMRRHPEGFQACADSVLPRPSSNSNAGPSTSRAIAGNSTRIYEPRRSKVSPNITGLVAVMNA